MPDIPERLAKLLTLLTLFITAILLIVLAHDYIPPMVVFATMISGLSGAKIGSALTPQPIDSQPTQPQKKVVS